MATRDPERTRRRLLQAALSEFAAHGYAGGRVARIAKRAGANQRMVYHYFGSKEGLYEAVFMHLDEKMLRLVSPLLDRLGKEPLSGLAEALRGFFDLLRQHPEYSRLTVADTLARTRPLPYEFTARDPGFQLLTRMQPLIEQGRAEGQLSDRTDVLLGVIVVLMFALMYPLLANRMGPFFDALGVPPPDRDAFAREQAVNLMLFGIAGPKAKGGEQR